MALMTKKKWAEAEVEFQKAVAEDPNGVKAHYNLASAASRAHDFETAVWEIAWVGNRSAWNDAAKAAAKKALKDDDLTWALKKWGEGGSDYVGDNASTNAIEGDLSQPDPSGTRKLPEGERSKMSELLAAAPGHHDSKCEASDAKQGALLETTLEIENEPHLTAVASLRDGVAIVAPGGQVLTRSEPLGCTGPGASQDQVATLAWLVVARGLGVDTPHHPPNPVADLKLIAVSYTTGGRRDWQTNLAVFARRDKTFVKVFEALLASSDTQGVGHVWQTWFGTLVYSAPGDTKKLAFGWDSHAFKFVAMP